MPCYLQLLKNSLDSESIGQDISSDLNQANENDPSNFVIFPKNPWEGYGDNTYKPKGRKDFFMACTFHFECPKGDVAALTGGLCQWQKSGVAEKRHCPHVRIVESLTT